MWIVAIVAGALLAGLPIIFVERVTNAYVERSAKAQLEAIARSSLGLADTRLDHAATLLVDLLKARVEDCSQASIDLMRRAAFASAPVQELLVLDADGRTLCSSAGSTSDQRVISREVTADNRSLALAMVRFRDIDERALRLRLDRQGASTVAALVPVSALLFDAIPPERQRSQRVRLLLDGGATGQRIEGQERDFDYGQALSISIRSARFPVVLTADYSRAAVAEQYDDVLLISRLVPTLISFFLILFSWLSIRRHRTDPTSALGQALDAGDIVPFFQPIVDLRTGRLRAAEVLARWRRPNGSVVMPHEFIPVAERSGQIFELTRILMRRARDEVGNAFGVRPNLRLSFNLCAAHFTDAAIVGDVKQIFTGSQIAFKQLVFEVTEREPLPDLVEARRVISCLQGLGCKVAIDDYGTGHGGMSYLLKLGVDCIKIDKMFVEAISTERYSQTIIETLVDLARNMRMEIIAEGVETFEQVEFLRGKGIGIAQGFLFAPPLPASSFLALVEAMEKPKLSVVGDAPAASMAPRVEAGAA
jgi:sensor c-di-GMP phosphodiesterase-like protein